MSEDAGTYHAAEYSHGWCVVDHGIEYHLHIEDAETGRIAVLDNWSDSNTLVRIIQQRWRPLFEFNDAQLVRMIKAANDHFDKHEQNEIDARLDRAISSRVVRELRKRGIR